MPARGIPASFWRGGTSRGLLFRAEHLAPFSPAVRDRIILTALGSPDPAGRQISGLGGGVSSLSKAAIVSVPGEAKEEQAIHGALPGASWADDGERNGQTWDIVYRFAQVGVKEPVLDWSASCGNMFTAAALTSIATPLIPYSTLFDRSRSLPRPADGQPLLFPLSILSASNGVLMRARVPIDPITLLPWEPEPGQGIEIAGVPGRDEAGIEVEMPLEAGERGDAGLVTGNVQDVVKLEDGSEVTVSILSSGLPNVFLPVSSLAALPSLSLPDKLLELPPSALSAVPSLSSTLEHIRTSAGRQFSLPLSLASPKITVVGPVPAEGYSTTSGTHVKPEEADIHVRAISSGDWHATIPGTTLGALNVGAGTPGTAIHDLISTRRKGGASRAAEKGGNEVVTVRAGHAAGVAESSVRFVDGTPESVVMVRTAREIMRGEVVIPESVFVE
ncbi:methylitaconate delta-isomerase [Rhodotorula toruloides]|uniref:Methylitaconate delta-isomerase n=1 Tax=Rhodotorula toruloides TaxID=5286 RepID=A0A511KAH4_RHOTO|nr:methylitaconate delta-isomerase [Rhodotorula toruloides]